jgi:hypothetical protein
MKLIEATAEWEYSIEADDRYSLFAWGGDQGELARVLFGTSGLRDPFSGLGE